MVVTNCRAKIQRKDYRSIDTGFLSLYCYNLKSQGNPISLTFFLSMISFVMISWHGQNVVVEGIKENVAIHEPRA